MFLNSSYGRGLFFLMSILSQTLFALVSSHFMLLPFFTTWHNVFRFVLALARGLNNNLFKVLQIRIHCGLHCRIIIQFFYFFKLLASLFFLPIVHVSNTQQHLTLHVLRVYFS